MHRIQEVVRLHRLGQGQRAISKQLKMSRDTIRTYVNDLTKAELLDGVPEDLPDLECLQAAINEHHETATVAPAPRSSVEEWLPKIQKLRDDGCGPTAIHDHLRLQCPGYDGSLSAVKRLCSRLRREVGPQESDVAIRVETLPGEVAQVDFGYAGLRYDPDRGVPRKCWVFVMTLCFSREMFCQLVFDQKVQTWLDVHVEAFEYFGGVPRVIVPDNLKSAVIRASFSADDDPVINRSYRELARAYGFQIDPTPPRSPEKKGKVESNVKYVRRNFLRSWETVDIDEDRRQLRQWMIVIAGQRRHGTTGRRPKELFEEAERQALLPLPAKRWEPVLWKEVKLHRDCHVQIDRAFYSAPWKLLGAKLWARCTRHSITLLNDDKHVHTHGRIGRGERRTVDEHLPEHRRDIRHRSREYWLERAGKLGSGVAQLATEIFGADDVLLQLRRVQSVVTHLETFPRERAQRTAARALYYRCLDYRSIKNILKKGLDLEPLPEEVRPREWSSGSRYARQATIFSSSKE